MEELLQELIQIKEKYLKLCKIRQYSCGALHEYPCNECVFNKILLEHDSGYETICDMLDRIDKI